MHKTTLRTRTPVREFLDSRGIRYQWVYERLGITQSHFSRILSGDRPLTQDMAQRLAELFGVEPSTFLPGAQQ